MSEVSENATEASAEAIIQTLSPDFIAAVFEMAPGKDVQEKFQSLLLFCTLFLGSFFASMPEEVRIEAEADVQKIILSITRDISCRTD
mgnify:CR=1 FL=1